MSESNNLDLPFLIGQFREYLNTEEGRYYSLHLRDKEPKEIREIVANLEHLSKNSDEFVKLVLYGLLPCRDSKYAKRSVLPVHQNIKRLFAKFHYTEDQKRNLALIIYKLVVGVKNNPNKLEGLIKKFRASELSVNLQSAALSPVFFALNLNFPIVNPKIASSYATLSVSVLERKERLSGSLEKYTSDIAKLDLFKNSLVDRYNFSEVKNSENLQLFLFWIANYIKIQDGEVTIKLAQPSEEIIPAIDEEKIRTFTEISGGPSPIGYPIEDLKKWDDEGKIIYNTEFQRGEVWNRLKKQKLIDSILRGYNINTIFFRHLPAGKYECLDGQQRLRTILKGFLENKFPVNLKITPEFNKPAYFRDLPELLQYRIRSYRIFAIELHSIDDAETCKIFLRLQEGLPLNGAERLNAMLGPLRERVVQASKHPFIAKLGIKDHRFAHRFILAQVFLLTEANQITEIKYKYLDPLYTNTNSTKAASLFNNVKKVLNFLEKELGDDASIIKYNGDFISLFLLAKYLSENYVTDGQEFGLKEFFLCFLMRVEEVKSSEKHEDAPYYDYKTYRRTSSDAKDSIERRKNVLLSKFLQFNPNLVQKDKTRLFDYHEKLDVYQRDQGICQVCQKLTSFDKGTVDHVKPHAKGGLTAIENAQWICLPCNQKKLAKFEDSPINT
ncbi:MAG: HNH endonuclease family protein [Halobacteriota archaeon]